jgi:folate-dependent phosphoribosylglycinamide formyltransferase PurN
VTIAVLTTDGSSYGFRVLNSLKRRGIVVDAAIVRRDSIIRKARLFQSVARRIGWLDAAIAAIDMIRAELAMASSEWRGAPLIDDYTRLAKTVHRVDNFESESTLQALGDIGPDYIILAQTGIIRDPVIRSARLGVLNAHPGWLPEFRGVDCAWWALHEGQPDRIGASLHLVDTGVDTGPIVWVKPLDASMVPSFRELQESLNEVCIDLLTDACGDIEAGRSLPRKAQSVPSGSQYYKMNRAQLKRAQMNYRAWTEALWSRDRISRRI